MTAAAICWGTLATWKLIESRRHFEDAQRRVDVAERKASESDKAGNAALVQAEAIKREAEATKREAEAAKAQVEETRRREEARLAALNPDLKRLVPGDNVTNNRYLGSFRIEDRTVRVSMTNQEDLLSAHLARVFSEFPTH